MLASRLQSTRARSFASKLLFLSLLPTLLFVGHWSLHIEIPGTDYFVGPPGRAVQAEGTHHHDAPSGEHSGSGHDHEQHCHANAATCADAAAVPVAPVAHLAEAIAALGADSAWLRIPNETRSLSGWDAAPQFPPPKLTSSA
ncbi:MAG: hypothetical protein KJ048_00320 [Dehalococcoidia bacterium]|nr:hypothetical protein [Dehalococcoidia bacterium]